MSRFFPLAVLLLGGCAAATVSLVAAQAPDKQDLPRVLLKTNAGEILIELDSQKAPLTVENFLRYVEEEHYDGTLFHRVMPDFMIQGGGFNADFEEKETHDPIENEATNGLKNKRGTLAMARTGEIHSATSQFFINVVDNDRLDHTATTVRGFGYCVFGRVIEGMETVDKIRKVKTGTRDPHENVPVEPVVIETARRVEPTTKAKE